jgi:hypothetical protein
MTLMSSKYSYQQNYFKAIFFRISDCGKTLWDIRLRSAITESRKLKNLDFVLIFQTLSRFCYNALPNLISQYTIIYRTYSDHYSTANFKIIEYNHGYGILAVTCHSIDMNVKRPLLIRNLTFYYYKTCHFDAV